jgi:thiamine phosphate synthase YjbQ (UPF0047 family)
MSKKELIKQTINQLQKLPTEKIEEVYDYAEFISKKLEDSSLIKGITAINIKSKSFAFLNEDEDLYSVEDLKEKF